MAKKKYEHKRVEGVSDLNKIRSSLNTLLKGTVASEKSDRSDDVTIYPSGILSLDLAIKNGGLLAGRIIDAWGKQGAGKTINTLTIGAHMQRNGYKFAFVDAEGTWSDTFAMSAGVDVDNVILVRHPKDRAPLTGEEFFTIIETLVQQGVEFIVVDSCPALVPSLTFQNQVGEGQKAQNAQLMSDGLKKLTPIVASYGNSCVWFINQLRSNM